MHKVAHSFLDAITGHESWTNALSRVADSFGGIESHFTVWDRAQGRVLFSARAGRFPADANEQYARYFHKVDTCKEALVWSNPGEVMLTQQYYGERFVNTEIYHDFLRPLGARYVMGVKLADCGPAVSMLRVHRSAKNGPYSDEDVRRLRCVFPSLAHSAQLYFRQLELARTASIATAALDQLDVGVLVIDRAFRVLHVNATASRILDTERALMIRSGRLWFDTRKHEAELQQLMDTGVIQSAPTSDRLTRLRVAGFSCSVSPLPEAQRFGESPIFVVTLVRADYSGPKLMSELQTRFGLTCSEAALADQIAAGRTLSDIAGRNSISLNTVRTHLKAVFAKMNVHSQSDLVRVALHPD
jgi:DNA-binding CsgD family transcriptional regulator/PAS domain-containing protein